MCVCEIAYTYPTKMRGDIRVLSTKMRNQPKVVLPPPLKRTTNRDSWAPFPSCQILVSLQGHFKGVVGSYCHQTQLNSQNSAQDQVEPFDCTGSAGVGTKMEPHRNLPTWVVKSFSRPCSLHPAFQ